MGREIGTTHRRPGNVEHFETALGDLATAALPRVIGAEPRPPPPCDRRSPVLPLIANELRRAQREGRPPLTFATLAVTVGYGQSTISHLMPQARRVVLTEEQPAPR